MDAYGLLLRILPASFRQEYGAEMRAVFEAQRRKEGGVAPWGRAIADVVANSVRLHADLLRQDLRWTFRALRQAPGFALTAVTVTALGMGANIAAFTLVDHVLLRPLPFVHPEKLAMVYLTEQSNGYTHTELSPPNYLDLRAITSSFESFSAYSGLSVLLTGEGEPQRLEGANVGGDLFRILGARPSLGRGFTAEDERSGAAPIVLLSDRLWKARFGADPGVVGRKLLLDEQPFTVVGVMPEGFAFPSRQAQLWIPLRFPPFALTERTNYYLYGVARLREGVTLEQARADLTVAAAKLERAFPKDNAGIGATAYDLGDIVSPQSRMLVLAVLGASFCVLLVACSNLANLLLVRAMTRRREIAVRMAIGAGRERLVRQLFTENAVLAALGGLCGLLLASAAIPCLARLIPNALPVSGVPSIDLRVYVFAFILIVVSCLGFGVLPAMRPSEAADFDGLRGRTGGGRTDGLRRILVLAEVTGTVVLLIAVGLLVKALWRVEAVNPGFRSEGILTLRTVLLMPKYSTTAKRTQFYEDVLSQTRKLPGVQSAAYISFLPMGDMRAGIFPVRTPGMPEEEASRAKAILRFVTPDYFKTLHIPLRKGRDVAELDTRDSQPVAVVSQSLAERYWPGRDPIGRQFNFAFGDRTVVGVVGDVAVRGLERSSEPQVYLPALQMRDGALAWYAPKDLLIRTGGNPMGLMPSLRRILRDADPDQAISDVRLLGDVVAADTASRRAQVGALGIFAGVAILLAAVGIYGLLSFSVSSRTQEVGVRLALGAGRGRMLGMFLREGLILGAVGAGIAIPLAYMAARSLTSLLFGVQPGDAAIYASAAALAIVMTLAGSVWPAVRAAGVDPAITIRCE